MSLYTFFSKKIVATIYPLTKKYKNTFGEYEKSLMDIYLTHQKGNQLKFSNHKESFEMCQSCFGNICEDNNIAKRWLERLKKYKSRFPDYEFVFVYVSV